jgi:hypothetical protein
MFLKEIQKLEKRKEEKLQKALIINKYVIILVGFGFDIA